MRKCLVRHPPAALEWSLKDFAAQFKFDAGIAHDKPFEVRRV